MQYVLPLTLNGTDKPTFIEEPKSFKEEFNDLLIGSDWGPAEDKLLELCKGIVVTFIKSKFYMCNRLVPTNI